MADPKDKQRLDALRARGMMDARQYNAAIALSEKGALNTENLRKIMGVEPRPEAESTSPLPAMPPARIPTDPKDVTFRRDVGETSTAPREMERTQENLLRQQGVETRGEGASAGTRLATGFAVTPRTEERELEKRIGAPVKRINGELVYLDEKTGRWTTVNPRGADVGDIAGAVGPGVQIGPGVVAGGLTAAATRSPSLTASAELLGEGAGGAARQAIGEKAFGIEQELDPLQAGAEAAMQAMPYTLGATAITKFLNMFGVGARSVSLKEGREILRQVDNNAKSAVDEMKRRGYDVKATPGQIADSQRMLDREATIYSRIQTDEGEELLRSRNYTNQDETLRFFKDVIGPKGPVDTRGVGQAIRQAGRRQIEEQDRVIRRVQEESQKRIEDFLNDTLPGYSKERAGMLFRAGIADRAVAAKQAVDRQWDSVREAIDFNPKTGTSGIRIPVTKELRGAIDLRKERAARAATKESEAARRRGIISIRGREGFDLWELQEELRDLRRMRRKADEAKDPSVTNIEEINRSIRDLEAERDKYLIETNPDVFRQIKDAETATAKYNDRFKRGSIGKMLEMDAGDYKMKADEVFNNIVARNNEEAAREVADIMGGDAASRVALRRRLLDFYRENASTLNKDGERIITPKSHRQFMDQYQRSIEPFLTIDEVKKMRSASDWADMLARSTERMTRRQQAIRNELGGKLEKLNSEYIVDSFFGRGKTKASRTWNIDDANKFTRWASTNDPRLLESTREAIRSEIADRALNRKAARGEYIDASGLDKIISENGRKLESIMGRQYVNDLRTLKETIETVSREGEAFKNLPWAEYARNQGIRIIWGPISHTGRALRGTLGLNKTIRSNAAEKLMLDPDLLREYTENLDRAITSENAIATLASLGINPNYLGPESGEYIEQENENE